MLTREQYVNFRKTNHVSEDIITDMWEFYQNTIHEKTKVDFETFRMTFPHYLQKYADIGRYLRYYDQMYSVMYLRTPNVNLVI